MKVLIAILITSLPLWSACSQESGAPRERVVIYSFTSRVAAVEREFERLHPAIDVVSVDLPSSKLVARLIAEQDSGRSKADVVYVGDAALVHARLLPQKRLTSHVPARLAEKLALQHRTPMLAHRLSTKVLLYNAAFFKNGAPITNIWELTEPAWRRRVMYVDPTQRGDYLDLFTEIALREGEMRSAFRQRYGRDLSAPAAGEHFLRLLLANQPIVVSSTAALNQAIGGASARHSVLGFGTYSDVRDNDRQGWRLAIAANLQPAAGIIYPAYLGVAADAPNPTGARLLIDFMMGDESPTGGAAFAPFHVLGDYPTRSDLRAADGAIPLPSLKVWHTDPARTAAARDRILDLLLAAAMT